MESYAFACLHLAFSPRVVIHDHDARRRVGVHRPCRIILLLPVRPLLLVGITLANVQTQTLAVEIDLVATLLQDAGDAPCILKLS